MERLETRSRVDHRRAATRERMIEAALEIITEEGTSALSKSRVCARAGMHRSGFYNHFKNVDELTAAAVEVIGGRLVARDARIRRFFDEDDPTVERDIASYEAVMKAYLEQPELTWLLMRCVHEVSPVGEVVRAAFRESVRLLGDELWTNAVRAGVPGRRPKEINWIARQSIDATMGAVAHMLETGTEHEVSERAAVLGRSGAVSIGYITGRLD